MRGLRGRNHPEGATKRRESCRDIRNIYSHQHLLLRTQHHDTSGREALHSLLTTTAQHHIATSTYNSLMKQLAHFHTFHFIYLHISLFYTRQCFSEPFHYIFTNHPIHYQTFITNMDGLLMDDQDNSTSTKRVLLVEQRYHYFLKGPHEKNVFRFHVL